MRLPHRWERVLQNFGEYIEGLWEYELCRCAVSKVTAALPKLKLQPSYTYTHTHNGILRALSAPSQYLHVPKGTGTNKVSGQTVWANIQYTRHGYKHYVCMSPNSEFHTTEDIAATFRSKECRQK